MRQIRWGGVVLAALLAVAVTAGAQEAGAQETGSGATFMSDMIDNMNRTAGQLVSLAEATPGDTFGWAPNEDVRTMSEVYMHVVGVNLLLPSMLGATLPEGIELPEGGPFALLQKLEAEVTSKEDVVAKLKMSFEYAAAALPEITDLETEVNLFGFPGTKRAYMLIVMSHAHEHLGQAIAYARSNGIVPPWSQQGEGGDG
jgi:uncharacterized damage-inducible protein DinB